MLAIAAAIPGIRRRRKVPEVFDAPGPDRDEPEPLLVPDFSELLRSTLQRDLSLAAEHVHSIWWLLEIARQHQQPIPAAALTNLDLVSKHLGEMRRRIEGAAEEAAVGPAISAFAHRR